MLLIMQNFLMPILLLYEPDHILCQTKVYPGVLRANLFSEKKCVFHTLCCVINVIHKEFQW